MQTRWGAPISGRWLACVSNNLCYVHSSNSGLWISCIRMLQCNSDSHIELGIIWAMDPRPCSLARWTCILHIWQHFVWEESWGSTLNLKSPCRISADDERVALRKSNIQILTGTVMKYHVSVACQASYIFPKCAALRENITILAPPTHDISSVPADICYIRWSKWMISSKFYVLYDYHEVW